MTAVLAKLLIPRVFHRIWLGGPLPERERAFGETWRRHHPDWELRLWRDEDVPPLANQALFDAAGSPAQKADILRYELLLQHGGVHLDTEFECYRSIEPLLGGVELFCAREDGFRAADALFGCTPGHPFIAAVVAALPDSVAWRPGRPRDEQTGQGLLTRVIAEQDGLGKAVPAVFAPELFFPYPRTDPHRAGETFPGAYAAYHWAKSGPVERHTPVEPERDEAPEPAARIVVTVDPDLVESGAAVLAGALEAASAAPGTELALVVKGVPVVTEAVGDAMAALLRQLAGRRALPDVVVYSEPEGGTLRAAVRVALSDDPAENARALRSLAAPGAAEPPAPAPVRSAPAAVYVGGGRLLVRTVFGDKLYCSGTDLRVTPDLALDGVVDPALCGFLGRWLRPGDTAFDVGADIGAHTVFMARTVGRLGRVLAYETRPTRVALLRDNIAVNAFDARVNVRERDAVTAPLDDALLERRPRLVKIDAEDAEADVLAGMGRWLAVARDTAIVVQLAPDRPGERRLALTEQVSRLVAEGWRLAALQPDGATAPVEPSALRSAAARLDTIALTRRG
jgi:hypothetical protein